MSTLTLLAEQVSLNLPLTQAVAGAPSGEGLIDGANRLAGETTTALKAVGGAAAVAIALVAGWRAKGAMAGMAMGLLVAFFYYWGLSSVGDQEINTKIDQDLVNGLGATISDVAPVRVDDVTHHVELSG